MGWAWIEGGVWWGGDGWREAYDGVGIDGGRGMMGRVWMEGGV